MSSIVIVLPKIEDGKRIRDILAKRGYEIDAVCSTAAAALGEMNNLNGGIVICGYKLPDMFFTDLNECMPSGFQMLLIASSRALSAVEGTGIMAVTMPLSVIRAGQYIGDDAAECGTAQKERAGKAQGAQRRGTAHHRSCKKPSDRTKSHDRVGGPSLHAEMQHGQRHQSG